MMRGLIWPESWFNAEATLGFVVPTHPGRANNLTRIYEST